MSFSSNCCKIADWVKSPADKQKIAVDGNSLFYWMLGVDDAKVKYSENKKYKYFLNIQGMYSKPFCTKYDGWQIRIICLSTSTIINSNTCL